MSMPNESLSSLLRNRLNLCFIILPKPNRKCGEKFCLLIGPHRTKQNKQVLRHKKVLTDLYVSCVGPSTFNGQDEYAERELESMGNDLHNNSHYDHNKSPSPFWIIMLPYCCLLHLFFPFSLGGHRGHCRWHGGHAQEVIGPAHLEFLKE